ncbi:3'(2'),5'-bisphosphate nucleotidase CysQ [Candidatus Woesearchaeota archaeon CG10_big_fil_rev_8_21_14_0_10_45_16]|nr:MAG: 3'(2'),5'-bisphosphate nucleotidase CysQ [Candidatus Woesearchaeota archaeon CG10_big_fil_rev_8_21_14_0_10_45_16]
MAIEGILEAGKAVMEIYSRDYDISRDKDGEPTTEADKKSNQILMNALGKTGHMILSEEDVNDEKRLGEEYVWIVDPIDGTSDFVNKTGEFTIMVGLVKDHVPVLGLVLWPPQKILFIGEKGKGAYKLEKGEWQKIRCSSKTDLKECRLMRSRHHLSEEEQRVASELGITMAAARGSSLKAMDIAQGSGDLYFTLTSKIKQWDTCASYCILTEAGGKMTDIFGNALQYNTTKVNHENGILATNGIVHENFIKNCQRH